jgi:hypothetical protein
MYLQAQSVATGNVRVTCATAALGCRSTDGYQGSSGAQYQHDLNNAVELNRYSTDQLDYLYKKYWYFSMVPEFGCSRVYLPG